MSSTVDRRQFLKGAAAIGAGTLIAGVTPLTQPCAAAPAGGVGQLRDRSGAVDCQPLEDASADIVFVNGTIHPTVSETVAAMAVQNGRVVALGDAATQAAGPATRQVDLKRAHVFAGFHDSHIHVLNSNFGMTWLPQNGLLLQDATSMDRLKQIVQDYLATHQPKGWLIGFGWHFDSDEVPSGVALDEVTGDVPVAFYDSGHTMLLNSVALRRVGITPETPDPPGGTIVRGADGQLTGWLREAAIARVYVAINSEISDEEFATGLVDRLAWMAQNGITGVSDNVGETGVYAADRLKIYFQMEQAGQLPLRVHYLPIFYDVADMDRLLEWLTPDHNTDLVRFASGKVFVDGGFDSGGSATSFAHTHEPVLYYAQPDLDAIVARAEELQMPMQYHVNGDLAIEMLLNALEKAAAQNDGSLRARHVPVHIAFATEPQRQRIKQLGLVVAGQPIFWHPQYDYDAAEYGDIYFDAYDYPALVRMGIPAGYGTDWAAVADELVPPLASLETVQLSKKAGAHNARRLSAAELVQGYTEGSALTIGRNDLGRLQEGCLADFVITDQDLLTAPVEEVKNIHILQTWVGGQRVASNLPDTDADDITVESSDATVQKLWW